VMLLGAFAVLWKVFKLIRRPRRQPATA
jgi:hypothetical protein